MSGAIRGAAPLRYEVIDLRYRDTDPRLRAGRQAKLRLELRAPLSFDAVCVRPARRSVMRVSALRGLVL